MELTRNQQKVLEYLKLQIKKNGAPPAFAWLPVNLASAMLRLPKL